VSLTLTQIYDRLNISPEELDRLCQDWHICELALFGSVLRDDFRPDSDIDLLVSYLPTAQRGLFEAMELQEVFEKTFGREVDLVSKAAILRSRNWLRKRNILNSAKVIYVSRSRIPH